MGVDGVCVEGLLVGGGGLWMGDLKVKCGFVVSL